jgi:hypothetical protein
MLLKPLISFRGGVLAWPFHASDRGSNPLGDANKYKGLRKQPLVIWFWVQVLGAKLEKSLSRCCLPFLRERDHFGITL